MTVMPAYAQDTEQILGNLDKNLEQKEHFTEVKLQRIGTLTEKMGYTVGTDAMYELSSELFKEYSSFQYDSAYVYADRCIALAKKLNDYNRMVEAHCHKVFCLLSSGLMKEAFDEFESIDASKADREQKIYYFSIGSRLNYDACDYNHASAFYHDYVRKGGEYTDSLLQCLATGDNMRNYYIGMKLMKEFKGDESVKYFSKFLQDKDIDTHKKAVVTSCLGWIYLSNDKEEKAIEQLAEAAICDNETATKETTALCVLGSLLYKRGDVERAVRYVQLALDDANFYNARLRLIQVGEILPIIQQDRYAMMKHQRNITVTAGCIFGLFALLLLWGVLSYRKQNTQLKTTKMLLEHSNNQLSDSNHQLEEVNRQMATTNRQLQEANKIKNEYIGRSFYTNSEYIKRVEKLYKTVDRKIATRQFEDLRQSIKESTIKAERMNLYSDFDETFLNIFPDFIEKFNKLFAPEDQKTADTPNTLTPEMRIFALIRLGISDSERISNFLNYSIHTINTYKTRTKNKALVANDDFESKIMEI